MAREIAGIEKYVRVTAQDREQVVNYFDRRFAEAHYCYTEPAFFEIFNFPIIRGDKTGQLVRPNTVVLTESAANRYFDEEDPIGKVLTFSTPSSQQNFEVTGVIADMPVRSHLQYDFLLSYSTIPKERQDIWYIHGVYTYVRLMSGKCPEEIEEAFLNISDKYKTDALRHKTWAVELIPLKDIHLTPQKAYEKEVKGSRTAVLILLVMSVALLLIGWANALNLTVARFLERGREFGLRKAFGASRRQIIVGYADSSWLAGTSFTPCLSLGRAKLWDGYTYVACFLGNCSRSGCYWYVCCRLLSFLADGYYTSVGNYEGETVTR